MGLSAGQARLLTITARKSDCEFESMRLSHQKIALARDLADLSNEYQNSLTQTKLVYDYYGTGSTDTPLSYGLLMQPSALNNYMPTLITDSLGRVALNSQYARAAEAAGIPQEGLGSLPSEDVRNKFISKLADNGLVSNVVADKILSLPYNQAAGLGGDVTVAQEYKDVTYSDLLEHYFSQYNVTDYLKGLNGKHYNYCGEKDPSTYHDAANIYVRLQRNDKNSNELETMKDSITLADLLNGVDSNNDGVIDHYVYWLSGDDGAHTPAAHHSTLANYDELWAPLIDQMCEVLDNGTVGSEQAINYAVTKFKDDILKMGVFTDANGDWRQTGDKSGGSEHEYNDCLDSVRHYNGVVVANNGGGDYNSFAAVDITNALNQFLTYYTIFYNGISNNTDSYGNQKLVVGGSNTLKSSNKLINSQTTFNIKTGTDISSDELATATFYDALFNQICANGWIENDELTDNNYLKEMLQSAKLFVSSVADDHYYYQGNYGTNKYIKEVADDTLIAYAESKYNTEKAKLNAKEQTLDLKMKNLDTEISSLTTEYDTVKNTITKNIEKSFKRYSA